VTDNDRREELAREHAERQQARAAHNGRGRRNLFLGVGGAAVVVVGGVVATMTLTGGTGDDPAPAASPTASASKSADPTAMPSPTPRTGPVTCQYRDDTSGAPAKDVGRPPAKVSKRVLNAKTMTIKTNLGDIVISLATAQTPCTVNSFAFLAKKHFFDNTVCHRLATPETAGLGLLQCGDPQAKGDGKNPTDGTGGPGYVFNDEFLGGLTYGRGVVFMAQSPEEANQNGSQFAISFSDDNNQLAQGAAFTTFGKITKGMDIVDRVSKGGVIINEDDITGDGGSSAPKIKVKIKTVVVK
jgi:peptidyl-prolyl cis-trans isomerase B (cyclophilin B)